jgi:hypothetical protein
MLFTSRFRSIAHLPAQMLEHICLQGSTAGPIHPLLTRQEGVLAGHLVRIVLVPAAHGQPPQQLRVGKLQVGHVPVQQLPLLRGSCSPCVADQQLADGELLGMCQRLVAV